VPQTPHSRQREPWLGLDVGTRRIGVALSNALGLARPLLTLERSQPRRDLRSILRLARRYDCAGIVVGNPLRLSGEASAQTARVHRFVQDLRGLIAERAAAEGATSLRVHLWDERLSTVEAQQALAEAGRNLASPATPRGLVDRAAAAIILQGWLDARGWPGACGDAAAVEAAAEDRGGGPAPAPGDGAPPV
jgi:putative Holliday junction resolvase